MTTPSRKDVIIFCEKRLTSTLLKRFTDEAFMTHHSVIFSDSDLLTYSPQNYSPVTIIGCEDMSKRIESLIHVIRSVNPQTHIILCWTQIPVPAISILQAFLESTDPDTFCHSSELTACLQYWQKGLSFISNYYQTNSAKQPNDVLQGWNELTGAEQRVLELLVEGLSGPEIANVLCISESTVNNHKAKIGPKLKVGGGPGSLTRFVVNNHQKLTLLFNN